VEDLISTSWQIRTPTFFFYLRKKARPVQNDDNVKYAARLKLKTLDDVKVIITEVLEEIRCQSKAVGQEIIEEIEIDGELLGHFLSLCTRA
jgi:hypothetical protein